MSPNTDEPAADSPSLPPGAITAFRLLGDYNFQNQASRPGILRSSQILASLLTSESQAARIREVLSAPDTYGGDGALCFIPRLGFTVGSGTEAVDVLICIECDRANIFRGDARTDEELSDAGRQRLTALQRELFPSDYPEPSNRNAEMASLNEVAPSLSPFDAPREYRVRLGTRFLVYFSVWLLAVLAFQIFLQPEGPTESHLTPLQQRLFWPLYTPGMAVVGLIQAAMGSSRPPDWAPWAVVAGFVGHFIMVLIRDRRSSFVALTCIQILVLAVAVICYVRQSYLPSGG